MDVILNDVYPEIDYPRKYQIYNNETLERMLFTQREFYVKDYKGKWLLEKPWMSGDTIYGRSYPSPFTSKKMVPEQRKSGRYYPSSEGDVSKRIYFYIDTLKSDTSGLAYFPLSGITRCDIYHKDRGKSTGFAILSVLGAFALAAGVLLLIAAFTSCPLVFAHDGNTYQLCGEIYGGAVYPSLERDDYLALPTFDKGPGSNYKIIIANMLQEIQYVNQADLLILTHDSAVTALVDKYGEVRTIREPVLPTNATDSKGTDCLEEVREKDQVDHHFDEDLDTTASSGYLNSLELTFNSDTNSKDAKLVINGKNSLWGDHMVRQFFDLFGKRYPKWVKYQETQPDDYKLEWMQQQGLFLLVYVKKGQEWQQVDYFNMIGALGSRDMVIPLDLEGAWTEEEEVPDPFYSLKIKLVSGYNFWELDYAALDFTIDAPVGQIWVQPDLAIDQDDQDVRELLASSDDRYMVQKETGDEATLDFTLPSNINAFFSLYLHSRGYYQQAGKNVGKPEISLLQTFREPGRLSLWSYQKMMEALAFSREDPALRPIQ